MGAGGRLNSEAGRGAMVRGPGGRVWLWLMVVVVVVSGSGVEAQQYLNQSFQAEPNASLASYDQTIQTAAYAAFASLNPVTGANFDATLTGPLANITVQAVRLRVGSLRRHPVTLGRFTILPGLRISNVSSLRVILVYRDLGSVSVYSSTIPGQVFVSSLVGIKLYNGDTLNSTTPLPPLTAIALENPVQVIIPPIRRPSYCVEFLGNGTAFATNASNMGNASSPIYACFSRTLGDNYFALVGLPPPKKKSKTLAIVLGTVLGFLGLVVILFALIYFCWRYNRKRKLDKMQADADRGETLQPAQVGNTRAPVATQSRTRPRLEQELNVT